MAKTQRVKSSITPLPLGAKALWIGSQKARKVFVFFHGKQNLHFEVFCWYCRRWLCEAGYNPTWFSMGSRRDIWGSTRDLCNHLLVGSRCSVTSATTASSGSTEISSRWNPQEPQRCMWFLWLICVDVMIDSVARSYWAETLLAVISHWDLLRTSYGRTMPSSHYRSHNLCSVRRSSLHGELSMYMPLHLVQIDIRIQSMLQCSGNGQHILWAMLRQMSTTNLSVPMPCGGRACPLKLRSFYLLQGQTRSWWITSWRS